MVKEVVDWLNRVDLMLCYYKYIKQAFRSFFDRNWWDHRAQGLYSLKKSGRQVIR